MQTIQYTFTITTHISDKINVISLHKISRKQFQEENIPKMLVHSIPKYCTWKSSFLISDASATFYF